MNTLLESIQKELIDKYNPHTIILYGSWARGDATDISDVDIACFVDNVDDQKDARMFNGTYLDAWIYPTECLREVSEDSLRFADGCCLLDERGLGESFILKAQDYLAQGPTRLSEPDRQHTVEWVLKMLNRTEHEDVEGMLRRCWLQFELLEIYFQLRGRWYLGPKKSLTFLKENDVIAYQRFADVYKEPTSKEKLTQLVNYVLSK